MSERNGTGSFVENLKKAIANDSSVLDDSLLGNMAQWNTLVKGAEEVISHEAPNQ